MTLRCNRLTANCLWNCLQTLAQPGFLPRVGGTLVLPQMGITFLSHRPLVRYVTLNIQNWPPAPPPTKNEFCGAPYKLLSPPKSFWVLALRCICILWTPWLRLYSQNSRCCMISSMQYCIMLPCIYDNRNISIPGFLNFFVLFSLLPSSNNQVSSFQKCERMRLVLCKKTGQLFGFPWVSSQFNVSTKY